jgi:quinoprotein glucose dehydrogenase
MTSHCTGKVVRYPRVMQFRLSRRWAALLASFVPLALLAAEADVNVVTSTGATEDAATAIRKFRAAPGLKIDLFAAEPMLANVVSFAFDEHGRCYVVESNRRRTSVFDIRGLGEWLDADFSFRTVEDRADFFRTTLSSTNPKLPDFLKAKRNLLADYNRDGTVDWRDLEVQSERIRLLVDTNADGRADVATTLAEGFDGITSGVAAGVLARKGEVWFTCIPDLWKMSNEDLRRTTGTPKLAAPINPHQRHPSSSISNFISGFGVHIAFGGHDMHGLKMGPDGKIYFSIADRGTGTNLWDRIVDKWPGLTMEALADSGAVYRCEPDGTQFEVVCIGLRNPQELAFDEFGNLFAGENNADGGDKARWIHVVEGADYGWRIGWQWLPKLGAWNSEMLWGMAGTNTSAYYLPPVAHIGAGPAGIAYYPGTGLPARYDRHFFMCDFRGGPNSVVRAFALRPKGASFEAYDESEFLTGPLCTDVDFGVDGAVYVSDWVKGWEKTDKGRIYRVFDPSTVNDPAVLEVKKLLGEGMEKRPNEELARLLGHRDMRVRLEAQWELVAQSPTNEMARALLRHLSEAGNGLARIHALWGLGQTIERGTNWAVPHVVDAASVRVVAAMTSSEATVRVQALRMLGRNSDAAVWTKDLSGDVNAQVQLSALLAMAKLFPQLSANQRGRFTSNAIPVLCNVLRTNGSDAYLRHAAVLALARLSDVPALLAAAKDESAAVRLGVCLALRRLQRPEIAQFLGDADPQIALEAARAINDVPISEATFALSQMLPFALWRAESHDMAAMQASMPLLRRALNAHFRLGQNQNAQALALFAANHSAPEALRVEALELLALWPKPPGRDCIVGLWRPLPPRDGAVAARELKSYRDWFETNASPALQLALKKTTAVLAAKQEEVTAPSISSEEFARLSKSLENGSLTEKQNALATLATTDDAGATKLLNAWLDKLLAGQVANELQLDVLEAAQKNQRLMTSPPAKEKLAKYESAGDAKDALAKWRECLYGGNAEEGKKTFIERQDAACFRCHKINGEGGEVGPEMAGLGAKQTREHLLESILFPNKTIAPGFESVLVTLKNGTSYAGMLKSETDAELIINSPEDGLLTVKKADVKSRDRGLSAMPEELGNILSKSDIRNLIEFLSTLK